MRAVGKYRRHVAAALMLMPLVIFLGLFFVWPIVSMLSEAVSDPVVVKTLPSTTEAARRWDHASPAVPIMGQALVDDIRATTDDQAMGDVVRRLNSAKSGFRTLMMKTLSAARGSTGPLDLTTVDPRWQDNGYWEAIAAASGSRYTDRNLLAALDYTRNPQGQIEALPPSASNNADIFKRTFVISGLVTLMCIAIGYPFAMLAASVTGWKRQLLLGAVLLPLWTSLLVRTAAWIILLQDQGLINSLLQALHLTSGPLPLLFNRMGVVIAMTHVLLPFMVLPIFSVLIGIPGNLMPAAQSLGASKLRAFWHVLLPLSLRGVASGALLVFMSAIGYYITPALVGGPRDQMISAVIAFYSLNTANWGMAGALGIILLAATLALYAVYHRLTNDRPVKV